MGVWIVTAFLPAVILTKRGRPYQRRIGMEALHRLSLI